MNVRCLLHWYQLSSVEFILRERASGVTLEELLRGQMRGEAYSGSAAAWGRVAGPDLLLPQYLFGPVRVAAQWVLSVICLEWCCHLGK